MINFSAMPVSKSRRTTTKKGAPTTKAAADKKKSPEKAKKKEGTVAKVSTFVCSRGIPDSASDGALRLERAASFSRLLRLERVTPFLPLAPSGALLGCLPL